MAVATKLTGKSLAATVGIPVIFVALFSLTPLIDLLESKVPLQIDFSVRHVLNLEPALNPKVKIFAFDDDSVRAFNNRSAALLADWRSILTQISQFRPRMVLIDKLFDLPEPSADYEGFVAAMKALPTPIVIGAFDSPGKIGGRQPLLLNKPYGQLATIIDDGTKLEDVDRAYPWLKENGHYAYGAPANVVEAFAGIGHIRYTSYLLPPIYRYPENHILMHWSFFATGGPKLRNGKLFVNGNEVPLTPEGMILINFLHEDQFKKIVYSMAPLARKEGQAPAKLPINEDDVVLILPGMFTGHADWVQSPMGEIPGGLLLASLINSGLDNKWIKILRWKPLLVISAAVAGGALALMVESALSFWVSLVLVLLTLAASGLGLFIYAQLVVPWFSMCLGLALTAVAAFAVRARLAEREHFRLRQELATAKIVQHQLFPPEYARLSTLQVVSKCLPAAECGGDFWNYFEVDNRQFLLIGDAVGHGMPAALVAASVHATTMTISEIFKTAPSSVLSPAYLLSHINSVLVSSFKSEITMTLFVAEFDLAKKKLRFANAGHCQPFLLNARSASGDGYQLLKSRGDPLGIDKQTTYMDSSIDLAPGVRLHFYTDGLIECRDQTGKILGAKRFTEHFRRAMAQSAEVAIKGVFDLVREYSRALTLDDDGTIVIVEAVPDLIAAN